MGAPLMSPRRPLTLEQVQSATEVLEAVVADRGLLADVPEEARRAFLMAAGRAASPLRHEIQAFSKALRRDRLQLRQAKDRVVRDSTAIRVARAEAVFTAPLPLLPGERREGPDPGKVALLLRVQGRVQQGAPLLRCALRELRRLQLRQALPDRAARRPGGADHRRPPEDRPAGGADDAARGRAGARHHPLPPRRRDPLREGARLPAVGPPPRGARPRPAPLALGGAVRALALAPPARASICSSTTPRRRSAGRWASSRT